MFSFNNDDDWHDSDKIKNLKCDMIECDYFETSILTRVKSPAGSVLKIIIKTVFFRFDICNRNWSFVHKTCLQTP